MGEKTTLRYSFFLSTFFSRVSYLSESYVISLSSSSLRQTMASTTSTEVSDRESMIDFRKSQSTIKREIAFKYLPLVSSASLTAFASTVMDPSVFAHFGEWGDTVRNSLWVSSCAGVGMWIYDRPHLKQVSERRRAFFALGLSSIFVQGSVLLCAMARRMSGDAIAASAPRMVLGAALAGGCLHFGKSYMELVDGDHDEELDGDDYDDEEEEEEVGLSDGAKETVAVA